MKQKDRRRQARLQVAVPIAGKVLPFEAPAILHDINRSGFAVRTTVNLTPHAAYLVRFDHAGGQVIVTGRLVHSLRISGIDDRGWYLAGFEFTEVLREQPAIDTLIARASALPAEAQAETVQA